MNALTPKCEKFCQLVVEGVSYVDAYDQSHPNRCARRSTTQRAASQLVRIKAVIERIAELRAPVIKKVQKQFQYTLDDAMKEIERVESLAQAMLQPVVMLAAVKLKAQLQKILVNVKETRHESPLDGATTDELLEVLALVRSKKVDAARHDSPGGGSEKSGGLRLVK